MSVPFGPNDPLPPLPASKPFDPDRPIPMRSCDEELSDDELCTMDQEQAIVELMAEYGIPFCFVGKRAMRHYQTNHLVESHDICVPRDLFDEARRAFLNSPDVYQPIETPNFYDHFDQKRQWAWFKAFGWSLVPVILPDSDIRFECRPSNIVRDVDGLPFPEPVAWVTALVDRQHWDFLEAWGEGTLVTEGWATAHLPARCLPHVTEDIRRRNQFLSFKYPREQYLSRFHRRTPELEEVVRVQGILLPYQKPA